MTNIIFWIIYTIFAAVYYFKVFQPHKATSNQDSVEFVVDILLSATWPITVMYDIRQWCNKFNP